jgi:hypothetical protein
MFNPKSIDPSLVTFSEIKSEGVKYKDRNIIDFSNIWIPPLKKYNSVRSRGKNVSHVQNLENSLSQGIDYSKMPPVVIRKVRNENGTITEYELVTGNHRMEAMRNLGFDSWVFDIYEIPFGEYSYEDAIRTFQLRENNFAPSLSSTEEDVVAVVVRLVAHNSKLVRPDEDSIRNYVEDVCTFLHPQTKSKIVRDAIRQLQKNGQTVYQDVITYTATDVRDFLQKETDLQAFGEFDFKRKQYGWSVLEGYEYEFLISAARKFAETGQQSYFTIHTKSPTEKYSVNDRRTKIVNQFKTLEKDLLKCFEFYEKTGQFPWYVKGCLPQDIAAGEKKYIDL